jgi:hypothetical protein
MSDPQDIPDFPRSIFKDLSKGSQLGILTAALNFIFFTATLWVKSGFVSKSEFENYKADQLNKREAFSGDLKSIAISLAHIEEQMKQNDRMEREIDAITGRVLELERRPNKQ